MKALAKTSLLLVLVLVVLSAYLRLDHSGIGCEPWPACYGNIGVVAESPTVASAYERLLEEASQPLSWARPLHRLIASVLGLAILGLCLLSLNRKNNRLLSFLLLALTVFLAWLGIYSEGLNSPAVVMGNLAGGFAMLGLLGWMVLQKKGSRTGSGSTLHRWTSAALILLCVQILLGGLTSANFAAAACQTIPDCHGSWLPGTEIAAAFDLSDAHTISDTGMVLGGAERAAVHKLHRLVAVLTTIIALIAGVVAVRTGADLRIAGSAVILLITTEFALGVSAILTSLPIGIAVAHNWVAALLLLGLLKLLVESREGADLTIRG